MIQDIIYNIIELIQLIITIDYIIILKFNVF